MQKHAGDPAAVPSEPTVGEPKEGLDQKVDPGFPKERSWGPRRQQGPGVKKQPPRKQRPKG